MSRTGVAAALVGALLLLWAWTVVTHSDGYRECETQACPFQFKPYYEWVAGQCRCILAEESGKGRRAK